MIKIQWQPCAARDGTPHFPSGHDAAARHALEKFCSIITGAPGFVCWL